MTFGQFLAILRARWRLAVTLVLLIVSTTLVVSFILPKEYSATASIVADPKPEPVSGFLNPGMGTPAFMATQVDVIRSDRVSQRVVRNLRLAEDPKVRQQWLEATRGEGSIEGWLNGNIRRSMDVKPSLESNVITISTTSSNPKFAATLANAFVQAYLEVSLELRVDPARQTSKFFDSRSKDARDALEKAQTRLSAYQKEKGVVISEDRFDIENARLNELSTQLVMVQALSSESGSRQTQAQGASADRLREVLESPVVGGIKNDLSRAEARLQELNARLGDNHPQVLEAKATINSLRSRLDSETRRVTGSIGVAATINRQREAELRASLEAQRAKVQRLRALRDEGGILLRDVESAQRAYDAVLTRLTQTSLESQTTQSNIYMLAEAYPPVLPSSPKIVLNTALSLVLGILLAMGAALGLESLDRRVRGIDDVSTAMGLPLLGVMPGPDARGFLGRQLKPMLARRVLGQLPMPHARRA